MKILFLDIDGVLNVMSQERDEYDSMFHPDCVDIGYGLTSICADKAIKILNQSNN